MSANFQDLRIISLIPSATEIIHCLGGLDALVGRSHECDYPSEVRTRPICTSPNLDPTGTSAAIHDQVESLLQKALSIYAIDVAKIKQLQPTHIVTQAQCEVCAVSLDQVAQAVESMADCKPKLISLQPSTLSDVFDDIKRVAECLGVSSQDPLSHLHDRIQQLKTRVQTTGVKVGCVEWTEPLMAAGNWVPELVSMSGGMDCLGQPGQHSGWIEWEQLQHEDPDLLIVMPCGFDLDATRAAVETLAQDERWSTLKAVRSQQVFLTDGNQYFNRPGPRLVDSLEILIEIIQHLSVTRYEGTGWIRWEP